MQSKHTKFAIVFFAIVCIIQSSIIAYLSIDYIQSRYFITHTYAQDTVEPVNICIIDKQMFTGYMNTYGKVKSQNFLEVKIPYFHGYNPKISKINCKAGSFVKQGDILMEFTCPELKYKLELSKKDVEQKQLYYKKIANIKTATSEYEVSKALVELEKAIIEYNLIQESINNLIIRAPFSGTVSKPEVSLNEAPDHNKILFSMYDQNALIVEFFIENQDLLVIKLNTKIIVESIDEEEGDRQIIAEAIVSGINPQVDEKTGKVKVIASIKQNYINLVNRQNTLKHNMYVHIYFDKQPIHDVFIVTKSAIIEDGHSHQYVRKVVNNNGVDMITLARITVVDHNHNIYAIKSEQLEIGDKIVIEGGNKRDGQPVVIKKVYEIHE